MAALHPRLLSSLVGDSSRHIHHLFRYHTGTGKGHISMQLSRKLSGLTNLLFNRRNLAETNSRHKRLKPGKISPCRPVPTHIQRPPYVKSGELPGIASGPQLHDEQGIECMRASGKLAAQVLQYVGTLVKPGITTDEIDEAVHQMIIDNGAYPSPLSYGDMYKRRLSDYGERLRWFPPLKTILQPRIETDG